MANKPRTFGLDASRVMSLVGLAAAVALAIVGNVLVARHYKRWDWTKTKRYTLTPATLATLRNLEEPVDVWVLMGPADPLAQSVKQLLVAYGAETTRLTIHYVDPDRDTAALEDVRKRFRIDTGRTEDGHVVADAIMVAAHGEKHWFIGPNDLLEVTDAEDGRAKPREEQAITGAIRNVIAGEKATLCFTTGHGEMLLNDGSAEGLGTLNDLLQKDNYETKAVDTTEPDAHDPFKGCSVVVIAGARAPFAKEEEARLKTYLMEGGNLLACVSPTAGPSESGIVPLGIDEALKPFGIGLDDDLVIETDAKVTIPETHGTRFYARAKPHGVSAGLVRDELPGSREVPRITMNFARSIHHVTGTGSVAAVDVLTTSANAFGVTSVVGAAEWADVPERKAKDIAGPLVLAMASERPKSEPSAVHGARVVVIGSGSAMIERNWREPLPRRGAAMLVDSAISWIASKPAILDVPAKPTIAPGLRITDDQRVEIQRYALLFMPLAAALLGFGVLMWRRGTEGAARGKKRTPRAES